MPLPKAPSKPATFLDVSSSARVRTSRTGARAAGSSPASLPALLTDPQTFVVPDSANDASDPRLTASGQSPAAPASLAPVEASSPSPVSRTPSPLPNSRNGGRSRSGSRGGSSGAPRGARADAGAPVGSRPTPPELGTGAGATASGLDYSAAGNLSTGQPVPPATPSSSLSAAQPADAPMNDANALPITARSNVRQLPSAGKRGRGKAGGEQAASGRRPQGAADEAPKLFVLDTNVLMHDPSALFRFAEHDVYLPMMTLEELDNHKRGMTEVARNARQVSRSLDDLIAKSGEADIESGLELSLLGNKDASGRLLFQTQAMAAMLPSSLPVGKADNQILGVVRALQERNPGRDVVLVSKDINMRIKARALGLPAEDYYNDQVLEDTDLLYSGMVALPPNFWDKHGKDVESWQQGGSTFYRVTGPMVQSFLLNQFVYLDGELPLVAQVKQLNGRTAVLQTLRDYAHLKNAVWGITARNREQNFALNLLMNPEIDFVSLLGQAGTGKTLLTLAAGLAQTIEGKRFSEIIMTRATVPVGDDIGYLPGTEEEKMQPWMGALEDNLEVLNQGDPAAGEWGRQATNDIIKSRVKVKAMSFMRGRTFINKFLIIDEAQNLTPKQMKTLVTRAGPGTKVICLGNIAQIDTPYLTEGSSGLTYVVDRFKGWAHSGHVTLQRGERSRLADFAADAL